MVILGIPFHSGKYAYPKFGGCIVTERFSMDFSYLMHELYNFFIQHTVFTCMYRMDFAIVEFTDDRSVAVVATNWLSQSDNVDICWWPPVPKSEKLVKARKEPGLHWTTFTVRVLHRYGIYPPPMRLFLPCLFVCRHVHLSATVFITYSQCFAKKN